MRDFTLRLIMHHDLQKGLYDHISANDKIVFWTARAQIDNGHSLWP